MDETMMGHVPLSQQSERLLAHTNTQSFQTLNRRSRKKIVSIGRTLLCVCVLACRCLTVFPDQTNARAHSHPCNSFFWRYINERVCLCVWCVEPLTRINKRRPLNTWNGFYVTYLCVFNGRPRTAIATHWLLVYVHTRATRAKELRELRRRLWV